MLSLYDKKMQRWGKWRVYYFLAFRFRLRTIADSSVASMKRGRRRYEGNSGIGELTVTVAALEVTITPVASVTLSSKCQTPVVVEPDVTKL
jgi:hypothetical protein